MPPPPPLGFPSRIVFSDIVHGQTASAEGGGVSHSSGMVNVVISGDTSEVFSVTGLEVLRLTRDPELPPGSPLAWETVATQDGAGPIQIGSAEALGVTVLFVSPANSAQATYAATAMVQTTATPSVTVLTVPIEASVTAGSITMNLVEAPPINPGSIADFRFLLISTMTQPAGGIFTCDSVPASAFSSDSNQFPTVPPNGTVAVTLPVLCAAGTAPGTYDVVFRFHPIDSSTALTQMTVPVAVVASRSVTVTTSLAAAIAVSQGDSISVAIQAQVTGGPATFVMDAVSIPNGLSLSNGHQSVAVDGTVFLSTSLDVDPAAPAGAANVPLVIAWSVPADSGHPMISGSLSFTVTVNLVSIVFTPQNDPIVAGEVHADSARVACASNGDWTFSARLHDFSTVFGDNFALGFAFNYTDGAAHGPVATGQLGSSATSNPETEFVGMQGNDPWLRQNWQKAFAGGGIFKLSVSADVGSALSDLGAAFSGFFGDVVDFFDGGTPCPTDAETGEPTCTDPGSTSGGGDDGGGGDAGNAVRGERENTHGTRIPAEATR